MKELKIDVTLARKLISKQFPEWASLNVTQVVPGGHDNKTFRLGADKLIRLPSAERYANKVQKEQYWLPILANKLKLDVPKPLAQGTPSDDYPWDWSIYEWIDGKTVYETKHNNKLLFAEDLANFLLSLHSIDTSNGPKGGENSFYRGCSPSYYNDQVLTALRLLNKRLNIKKATSIWQSALATDWNKSPVWVHGDISVGNLLMKNGRLNAVIDFSGLCIGDPACDLAIAWTYLDASSRKVFKNQLNADTDLWLRGAAWALWKALIIEAGIVSSNEVELKQSNITLLELLASDLC